MTFRKPVPHWAQKRYFGYYGKWSRTARKSLPRGHEIIDLIDSHPDTQLLGNTEDMNWHQHSGYPHHQTYSGYYHPQYMYHQQQYTHQDRTYQYYQQQTYNEYHHHKRNYNKENKENHSRDRSKDPRDLQYYIGPKVNNAHERSSSPAKQSASPSPSKRRRDRWLSSSPSSRSKSPERHKSPQSRTPSKSPRQRLDITRHRSLSPYEKSVSPRKKTRSPRSRSRWSKSREKISRYPNNKDSKLRDSHSPRRSKPSRKSTLSRSKNSPLEKRSRTSYHYENLSAGKDRRSYSSSSSRSSRSNSWDKSVSSESSTRKSRSERQRHKSASSKFQERDKPSYMKTERYESVDYRHSREIARKRSHSNICNALTSDSTYSNDSEIDSKRRKQCPSKLKGSSSIQPEKNPYVWVNPKLQQGGKENANIKITINETVMSPISSEEFSQRSGEAESDQDELNRNGEKDNAVVDTAAKNDTVVPDNDLGLSETEKRTDQTVNLIENKENAKENIEYVKVTGVKEQINTYSADKSSSTNATNSGTETLGTELVGCLAEDTVRDQGVEITKNKSEPAAAPIQKSENVKSKDLKQLRDTLKETGRHPGLTKIVDTILTSKVFKGKLDTKKSDPEKAQEAELHVQPVGICYVQKGLTPINEQKLKMNGKENDNNAAQTKEHLELDRKTNKDDKPSETDKSVNGNSRQHCFLPLENTVYDSPLESPPPYVSQSCKLNKDYYFSTSAQKAFSEICSKDMKKCQGQMDGQTKHSDEDKNRSGLRETDKRKSAPTDLNQSSSHTLSVKDKMKCFEARSSENIMKSQLGTKTEICEKYLVKSKSNQYSSSKVASENDSLSCKVVIERCDYKDKKGKKTVVNKERDEFDRHELRAKETQDKQRSSGGLQTFKRQTSSTADATLGINNKPSGVSGVSKMECKPLQPRDEEKVKVKDNMNNHIWTSSTDETDKQQEDCCTKVSPCSKNRKTDCVDQIVEPKTSSSKQHLVDSTVLNSRHLVTLQNKINELPSEYKNIEKKELKFISDTNFAKVVDLKNKDRQRRISSDSIYEHHGQRFRRHSADFRGPQQDLAINAEHCPAPREQMQSLLKETVCKSVENQEQLTSPTRIVSGTINRPSANIFIPLGRNTNRKQSISPQGSLLPSADSSMSEYNKTTSIDSKRKTSEANTKMIQPGGLFAKNAFRVSHFKKNENIGQKGEGMKTAFHSANITPAKAKSPLKKNTKTPHALQKLKKSLQRELKNQNIEKKKSAIHKQDINLKTTVSNSTHEIQKVHDDKKKKQKLQNHEIICQTSIKCHREKNKPTPTEDDEKKSFSENKNKSVEEKSLFSKFGSLLSQQSEDMALACQGAHNKDKHIAEEKEKRHSKKGSEMRRFDNKETDLLNKTKRHKLEKERPQNFISSSSKMNPDEYKTEKSGESDYYAELISRVPQYNNCKTGVPDERKMLHKSSSPNMVTSSEMKQAGNLSQSTNVDKTDKPSVPIARIGDKKMSDVGKIAKIVSEKTLHEKHLQKEKENHEGQRPASEKVIIGDDGEESNKNNDNKKEKASADILKGKAMEIDRSMKDCLEDFCLGKRNINKTGKKQLVENALEMQNDSVMDTEIVRQLFGNENMNNETRTVCQNKVISKSNDREMRKAGVDESRLQNRPFLLKDHSNNTPVIPVTGYKEVSSMEIENGTSVNKKQFFKEKQVEGDENSDININVLEFVPAVKKPLFRRDSTEKIRPVVQNDKSVAEEVEQEKEIEGKYLKEFKDRKKDNEMIRKQITLADKPDHHLDENVKKNIPTNITCTKTNLQDDKESAKSYIMSDDELDDIEPIQLLGTAFTEQCEMENDNSYVINDVLASVEHDEKEVRGEYAFCDDRLLLTAVPSGKEVTPKKKFAAKLEKLSKLFDDDIEQDQETMEDKSKKREKEKTKRKKAVVDIEKIDDKELEFSSGLGLTTTKDIIEENVKWIQKAKMTVKVPDNLQKTKHEHKDDSFPVPEKITKEAFERGFQVCHEKVLTDGTVAVTLAHMLPKRFYKTATHNKDSSLGKCLMCLTCSMMFTPVAFTVHHDTNNVVNLLDHTKSIQKEYHLSEEDKSKRDLEVLTMFRDFTIYFHEERSKRVKSSPIKVPTASTPIEEEPVNQFEDVEKQDRSSTKELSNTANTIAATSTAVSQVMSSAALSTSRTSENFITHCGLNKVDFTTPSVTSPEGAFTRENSANDIAHIKLHNSVPDSNIVNCSSSVQLKQANVTQNSGAKTKPFSGSSATQLFGTKSRNIIPKPLVTKPNIVVPSTSGQETNISTQLRNVANVPMMNALTARLINPRQDMSIGFHVVHPTVSPQNVNTQRHNSFQQDIPPNENLRVPTHCQAYHKDTGMQNKLQLNSTDIPLQQVAGLQEAVGPAFSFTHLGKGTNLAAASSAERIQEAAREERKRFLIEELCILENINSDDSAINTVLLSRKLMLRGLSSMDKCIVQRHKDRGSERARKQQ